MKRVSVITLTKKEVSIKATVDVNHKEAMNILSAIARAIMFFVLLFYIEY